MSEPSQSANGNDRRAAVRYPCTLETSCYPVGAEERDSWTARVQDISVSGIGLIVTHPVQPGASLGVDLQSPDQELTYTLMTQVVHARPQADGTWMLGCSFARSLSEDELQSLL